MENTTALTCCFLRTYHEKNNSVRLFSDPAAEKLLGEDYGKIAKSMTDGTSCVLAVRKRTAR